MNINLVPAMSQAIYVYYMLFLFVLILANLIGFSDIIPVSQM